MLRASWERGALRSFNRRINTHHVTDITNSGRTPALPRPALPPTPTVSAELDEREREFEFRTCTE